MRQREVDPDGSQRVEYAFAEGRPIALSGSQWWFIALAPFIGFAVLLLPAEEWFGRLGPFLAASCFALIPLAALRSVAGTHWKAVFRRVGLREVRWMIGFALLNILVTFMAGAALQHLTQMTSNPAIVRMADASPQELVMTLLATLPQLLGEELISILPMLALYWWLMARAGMPRRTSLVIAWLASGVWFGLLHLPTYGWNWLQCLLVIGTARLVLSLAWLRTGNLWVSTGAHVLNDWLLFGMSIGLARLAVAA